MVQRLSDEKNALEQELRTQQTALSTAEVKLESVQHQLSEKQARIDELNRLNRQVQSNLEHYREAVLE